MYLRKCIIFLAGVDCLIIGMLGIGIIINNMTGDIAYYKDEVVCQNQIYIASSQENTVNSIQNNSEDNEVQICNVNLESSNVKVALTTANNLYLHTNAIISGVEQIIVDNKKIINENIQINNLSDGVHTIESNGGLMVSDTNNPQYIYKGNLIIYKKAEGAIIVNETNLDNYIEGVVASEMPDSFSLEAKKAQAICSRSYYLCNKSKLNVDGIETDLDDTTRYQVFGRENPSKDTVKAVEETKGMVIKKGGETINATFFSTSCGYTADSTVWGDDKKIIKSNYIGPQNDNVIDVSTGDYFNKYINSQSDAYEKDCSFFRWKTYISMNQIKESLQKRGIDIGAIINVSIIDRGAGGIVSCIRFTGDNGVYENSNQYEIRQILAPNDNVVNMNDGEERTGMALLPSAFISVKKKKDKLEIIGGGYGHGVGMSQYGAQKMAEQGNTYKDILFLFYR